MATVEISKQLIHQALLELPIVQRQVCFALRSIQQKIDALITQEQKQIDHAHLSFIKKFKIHQQHTLNIIKGKILSAQDLKGTENLFTETQNVEKQQIMKQGNKIERYWKTAILNSQLSSVLTPTDQQLLNYLQEISTDITQDALELSLTFSDNTFVKANTFKRKLVLQNGNPVRLEGDIMKLVGVNEGIFKDISNNTHQQDTLFKSFRYFEILINEIVPYSLEYYLGANDEDQQEQSQHVEDENQQEQDEQDEK